MLTQRLYQTQSHLTACEARVLRVFPTETGCDAILDRTVIFENAGGQPSDTGTLGALNVLGSDEKDGELYHHLDGSVSVGDVLPLKLNVARRFDFMQQHTGEHLLSWAFYHLYGVNNVGFHLAETYATVDLDRPLTAEQLEEAQLLANRCVTRNLPVTAQTFETEEALRASGISLRKQADGLTAPIRVVSICDTDCCTCCAPHCAFSGEIGSVLITEAFAYKGGTRLGFLCGERALRYAMNAHNVLDGLARSFSTAREHVLEAVEKLKSDCFKAHANEKSLAASLNGYLSKELCESAETFGKTRLILSLLPAGTSADRLRPLALSTLAAEQKPALTVLFTAADEKLSYVLAGTDTLKADIGELCRTVNTACGGKGGGRGTLAQGTAPLTGRPEETVAQLKAYFTSLLKNS